MNSFHSFSRLSFSGRSRYSCISVLPTGVTERPTECITSGVGSSVDTTLRTVLMQNRVNHDETQGMHWNEIRGKTHSTSPLKTKGHLTGTLPQPCVSAVCLCTYFLVWVGWRQVRKPNHEKMAGGRLEILQLGSHWLGHSLHSPGDPLACEICKLPVQIA